ncbi:MAG: Rossmann fold nucleotide-binding protein [Nocardioides sp.]|nr:Rossmann fold nucleotide-binding protein [Nocardioides sp.]
MRTTRGRVVHVGTLAELDRRAARGGVIASWRVHDLDLTGREAVLDGLAVAGASFLGCTFAPGQVDRLRARGALVLPAAGDVPVDVHRRSLYTATELYDAATWATGLDGRAYAWSQTPGGPDAALARALHDHAIDEALTAWVARRRLVGVMGGHAWRRDEPDYLDAVHLGRVLGAAGLVVATGGGPGAMEAANLGAWLADEPAGAVAEAVAMLAPVPTFRPSVDDWARSAFTVRDRFTRPRDSLAVPTWHYGHEPPHVFGTAIAKYFRNATREAILLQVCGAGIIFLTGAAGTVQEVFQDACENYYAQEGTVAPMVLVGREYWTETLPAWPLLQAMARGRAMQRHVHLVDTLDEAAALVSRPAARG